MPRRTRDGHDCAADDGRVTTPPEAYVFTATKDLMLPATVTGSWPRPRWYTENMWGRPLDTMMMNPWYREQFSDAHAIVVSDQERVGLQQRVLRPLTAVAADSGLSTGGIMWMLRICSRTRWR